MKDTEMKYTESASKKPLYQFAVDGKWNVINKKRCKDYVQVHLRNISYNQYRMISVKENISITNPKIYDLFISSIFFEKLASDCCFLFSIRLVIVSGDIEEIEKYMGNVDLERNALGYTALIAAALNGTNWKPMSNGNEI